MKDIAHRAGVSQATVSHVLRGRDGEFRISAATAARISEIARQLGYRPSALARNLKNPFWAGLAMGAQDEAERHGYTLVVSHTGETEEKELSVVEMLREQRVDGAILSP